MVIVYKDEETLFPSRSGTDREEIMLGSLTTVKVEMKMEPELYIYIQKLMKEQNKSFDEIVNKIIRDKAEKCFITKIEYVPVRDIQPYVYPYNDSIDKTPKIWCGIDSSITTSTNGTITNKDINLNYANGYMAFLPKDEAPRLKRCK